MRYFMDSFLKVSSITGNVEYIEYLNQEKWAKVAEIMKTGRQMRIIYW